MRSVSMLFLLCLLPLVLALAPSRALAHCDGLDGPVVRAAREALRTGDLNRVLIWVREGDEAEIRTAFRKARVVRGLGPTARELADQAFFETLVRLHRAGEGAPYTGLKPAGRDLGPAIPAADRAVETGEIAAVESLLVGAVRRELRARLQRVAESGEYAPTDVPSGRRHVEAYVGFIHYVERLYEAAVAPAEHHYEERAAASAEGEDHRAPH